MRENLVRRMFTIVLITLILFILISGFQLKHQDKEDTPLKDYYRAHSQETGSDNLVGSILLDYRAFDTFGEVMVLYITITGVIILGKKVQKREEDKK